ncbi:MAG: amidohydrolase family protein [Verrucomicrobiales bacterium]|nr:amidohydrolase family protein [Verrucomicrobiales bacterium]
MKPSLPVTRRDLLKGLGATGALAALGPSSAAAADSAPPAAPPRPTPPRPRNARSAAAARRALFDKVQATTFIDTHEHLIEETDRLQGTAHPRVPCDDFALLFSHYLDSDLATAGMPAADLKRFLSPGIEPAEKWRLLEPWWPAVKHTGYAQAVRIALEQLYGVVDLSAATVRQAQEGYERLRRPGFYERVLRGVANLESCQVNCLTGEPFKESGLPTLLMQDLSIVGMFAGPNFKTYAEPAGINVQSLADWHRVITWWFDRYGRYAVAAKSQHAYSRDIDYARVPPEQAEPVFRRVLARERISAEDRRLLEDHLFWQAVDEAGKAGLPVKLHTGYYAGHNSMPLHRLARNPGSATDLCRLAPQVTFVFMHICYPYYEDIIAAAKQHANACVDLCWAWIINPIASKDFLKKFLVTAPANKLLTFGGDYIPVEPVVGHAALARRGIALALAELVEEGWLSLNEALGLVDPIMHENARRLFKLPEKEAALKQAPWATAAARG